MRHGMFFEFFDIKTPIRVNIHGMTHLIRPGKGDLCLDEVGLGKTEIPTYLQSYASTLVANINLDDFTHLKACEERVVIHLIACGCLGTVA